MVDNQVVLNVLLRASLRLSLAASQASCTAHSMQVQGRLNFKLLCILYEYWYYM